MCILLLLGMDNLNFVAVKFHFGGEFILGHRKLQYARGLEGPKLREQGSRMKHQREQKCPGKASK
jgi:hypothetical protein